MSKLVLIVQKYGASKAKILEESIDGGIVIFSYGEEKGTRLHSLVQLETTTHRLGRIEYSSMDIVT